MRFRLKTEYLEGFHLHMKNHKKNRSDPPLYFSIIKNNCMYIKDLTPNYLFKIILFIIHYILYLMCFVFVFLLKIWLQMEMSHFHGQRLRPNRLETANDQNWHSNDSDNMLILLHSWILIFISYKQYLVLVNIISSY